MKRFFFYNKILIYSYNILYKKIFDLFNPEINKGNLGLEVRENKLGEVQIPGFINSSVDY